MTNYSTKTVTDYIAQALPEARPHLQEIRAAIQSAVPKAEEDISYGKPWFKYKGMLAGFDACKKHISFEIWADELQQTDRNTLEEKGYKTGKRTFQIRFDQKVPITVIKNMVKAQAATNDMKK